MCSQQISNQLISQYQVIATQTRTKRRLANLIIVRHESLITSRVNRFLGRGVDKDELMNCGRFGLYEALEEFDMGRGTQLSTFAVPSIDNHLRLVIKKYANIHVPKSARKVAKECAELQAEQGPLSAQELGNQLGKDPKYIEGAIAGNQYRCISLSCQDSGEDLQLSSEASPMLEVIAMEQIVWDAVNELPAKWVITVSLRVVEEKSFAEIARITGYAVRSVRTWCSNALKLLRHRLGKILPNSSLLNPDKNDG